MAERIVKNEINFAPVSCKGRKQKRQNLILGIRIFLSPQLSKKNTRKICAAFIALGIIAQLVTSNLIPYDMGAAPIAHAAWYATGGTWSYRKAITVDHTKIPNTDQTNFPMLVSFTDPSLRTTTNSGNVQNTSGYDIIFTAVDGSTKLDHEIEKYDGATGTIAMWVRIPTLSHLTDTVIYMYFGNTSITTTQENKTGVWGENGANNFKGVWHMKETGTNPTVNDSTSNANNSTAQTWTPGAGQVSGGGGFNGSGQYVGIPKITPNYVTAEAWIYLNGNPASGVTPAVIQSYGAEFNDWGGFRLGQNAAASTFVFGVDTGPSTATGTLPTAPISLGAWHHLVGSYNGSVVSIYVDGALSQTANVSGTIRTPSIAYNYIGYGRTWSGDTGAMAINGSLDEARISSVARSADWIKTEYNNQSDPSTFYSLGIKENTTPTVLTSWSYRKAITIDHTKVSGTGNLANFPVLINLSADTDLAANAKSDGSDILFTNSSVAWNTGTSNDKLAHEIETYTTSTGSMQAWVRIPFLSPTQDTVIYMYYGNSTATNQQNKTDVWDSNTKMVQHMKETGTNPTVNDSTSNANNSTAQTWTPGTGMIGGGGGFNGSSQYIGVSRDGLSNLGDSFTIEAWVKQSSVTSGSIFSTADVANGSLTKGYSFFINQTSASGINANSINLQLGQSLWAWNAWTSPTNSFSAGTYHHVVAEVSGANTSSKTVSFFVDGVAQTAGMWTGAGTTNGAVNYNTANTSTRIGSFYAASYPSYTPGFFTGNIDELRISQSNRSADWIKTEYNNQSSPGTFYTVGSKDSVLSPMWHYWQYRQGITIANNAGQNVSGYQVKLTLNTKALVDAGKMKSDCSDMRFSESDGSTNVPYWIESGGNTTATTIWIKTDLTYPASKNVYMYYGNSGASAVSDGNAVFDFLDEFNSLSGWTQSGGTSGTVSGGILTIASTSGGSADGYLTKTVSSKLAANVPIVMEYLQNITNSGGAIVGTALSVTAGYTTGNRSIQSYHDISTRNGTISRSNSVAESINVQSGEPSGWQQVKGTFNYSSSTNEVLSLYYAGTYYAGRTCSNASSMPTGTLTSIQLFHGGWNKRTAWLDWIRIRKFVSSEPTLTYNSEEPVVPPTVDHFGIAGSSSQDAGSMQQITITAIGSDTSTYIAYTGEKTVRFSGANPVGAYSPTCGDKYGTDVAFGQDMKLDFTTGVAHCNLKLYKAETAAIDIRDQVDNYNADYYPLNIVVAALPLSSFDVTNPAMVYNGTAFPMTIIGKDIYGNIIATIPGATSVTASSGSITPNSLSGTQMYLGPDGQQYSHEKDIKITNSLASILTDYQVKLTLDTTGVSQTSTCNDIRFATTSNTNIPYWYESGCGTTNTIVWLKTTIPATTTNTIYWYYGNGSVSSAASGDNVFSFFDDFSGSSLNMTKWDVTGDGAGTTPSGGSTTVSDGIMTTTSSSDWRMVASKTSFGTNTAIRARLKSYHASSSPYEIFAYVTDSSRFRGLDAMYSEYSSLNNSYYAEGSGSSTASIQGWTVNTYGIQEMIRNSTSSSIFRVNDGNQVSLNTGVYTGSDTKVKFMTSISGGTLSADWVLVRQYASTEPTSVTQSTSSSNFLSGPYNGNFTITNAASGSDTLTFTNGAVIKTASVFVDSFNHYHLTSDSNTQAAGTIQNMTITAVGQSGDTFPYTGTKTLTFSGAESIGSFNPKTNTTDFGTSIPITFTNGTATVTLTLYKSQNASIVATDTDETTIDSPLPITVTAGTTVMNLDIPDAINAGTSFTATLSMHDSYGNGGASYDGPHDITFSGANSIGAHNPKCNATEFGTPISLTFSGGTASCSMTLYKAENASVIATEGAYHPSKTITVSPLGISSLAVDAPDTVSNGQVFDMTVSAKDIYGNPTNNLSGDTNITTGIGTIVPTSITQQQLNNYLAPDSNRYSYEKDIHITNSLPTVLTDYQVKLTLDTTNVSQTSTCNDIRFADITNTNIPYWYEGGCGTNNTIVWIKTTIPASTNKTIYFYYGNSTVSSGASGDNTFIFFDDFKNGISKWSGGASIINEGGVNELQVTTGYNADSLPLPDFQDIIVESRFKYNGFGSYGGPRLEQAIGPILTYIESYANGSISSGWHGTWLGTSGGAEISRAYPAWSTGTWYNSKIITTSSLQSWVVGSTNLIGTYARSANVSSGTLRFRTWDSGDDLRISLVKIRKYASAEPASESQTTGSSTYYSGTYSGPFTISGVTTAGTVRVTATNSGISGYDDVFVDAMHHFKVEGANTVGGVNNQPAGSAQLLTVTAIGGSTNVFQNYDGVRSVILSGADNIGSYYPTCTDKDSNPVRLGQPMNLNFVHGVATCSLVLYKSQAATIDITDGQFNAHDNVLSAHVTSTPNVFNIQLPPSTDAGASFQMTLTAQDSYGNSATEYTGFHDITFTGAGSMGANAPFSKDKDNHDIPFGVGNLARLDFHSGVATTILTLYKAESPNIEATDGTYTSSASIDVNSIGFHSFDITAPTEATSGVPFRLSLTPRDMYGNITTDVSTDTTLHVDHGNLNGETLTADNFHYFVGPDGNNYSGEKDVTITNSSTTSLPGQQVKLDLDTHTLISDGKLEATCSDLRFAQTDGTNIPYWIEGGCDSSDTIIWLKTDLPASADKTVYMFYGNASVPAASDGSSVFDFFDDFNDTSKWNTAPIRYSSGTGSMNVAGGVASFASTNLGGVSFGTNEIMPAGNIRLLAKINAQAGPTSSQMRIVLSDSSSPDPGTEGLFNYLDSSGQPYSLLSCNGVENHVSHPWVFTTPEIFEWESTSNARLWIDGFLKTTLVNTAPNYSGKYLRIWTYYGSSVSVDWIAVGKEVSSDPVAHIQTTSSAGVHNFNVTISGVVQQTLVNLTVTNGTFTDSSHSIDVAGVDYMDHFRVSGPANLAPGETGTLTVTAIGKSGNPYVLYTGDHILKLSGADALGTNYPTCGGTRFGEDTTLAFNEYGVATCALRIYKKGVWDISSSDGVSSSAETADKLHITIATPAASLHNLEINAPDAITSETPFNLILTAKDQYGNLLDTLDRDTTLSITRGSLDTMTLHADAFTDGVYNGQVTVNQIYVDADHVTFSVTNGAVMATKTISIVGVDHMGHLDASVQLNWNETMRTGNSYTLKLNAVGLSGNPFLRYDGQHTFHLSGADAIGSFAPTLNDIPFGTDTPLTFSGGHATGILKIYKKGGYDVYLQDESIYSVSTGNLGIEPNSPATLSLTNDPSVTCKQSFNYSVIAYDAYGNVTNWVQYNGLGLSADQGAYFSPDSVTYQQFSDDGQYSGSTHIYGVYADGDVTITASLAGATGTSHIHVLGVNEMNRFGLSSEKNTQEAGESQLLTVRALLDSGEINTAWNTPSDFTFSGANSVGGNVPTCGGQPLSGPVHFTFTGGVASCPLVLYASGTSTLSATGAGYPSNTLSIGVSALPAVSFDLPASFPDTVSGQPFNLTTTARDIYGNVASIIPDDLSLIASSGNISAGVIPVSSFTNGIYSGQLSISGLSSGADVTLTFISGEFREERHIHIVGADELSYLTLSGPTSFIAGTSRSVTLTAITVSGQIATDFQGQKDVVFSLSNRAINGGISINGHDPTVGGAALGSTVRLTFENGVASADLLIYKAGSFILSASTSGFGTGSHYLSLGVSPLAASRLNAALTDSTAVSETPFTLRLSAQDQYGNATDSFPDDVGIITDHGTLDKVTVPASSFSGGSYSGPLTLTLDGISSKTDTQLTLTSGTVSTTKIVGVYPVDQMYRFALSYPGSVRAGEAHTLTITAIGLSGNRYPDYVGEKEITLSGPAGIGTYIPSCAGQPLSAPVRLTFRGGVASCELTLFKAESFSLAASDGTFSTQWNTASVQVSANTVADFAIQTPPSVTSGTPFSISLDALDPYGNISNDVPDDLTVSSDYGTLTPLKVNKENLQGNGTYTQSFTLSGILTDVNKNTLTFRGGLIAPATPITKTVSFPVIGVDHMHHFRVEGNANMTAGTSQVITITAIGESGNVFTGYAGVKNLLIRSNVSGSIGTYTPTCTDRSGNDIFFGSSTPVSFSNGSATCTMKLYKAGTFDISASSSSYSSTGNNLHLLVTANTLHSFSGSVPTIAVTDQPFLLTLTAKDLYGNTTKDVGNSATLSTNEGILSPSSVPAQEFTRSGTYTRTAIITGISADKTVSMLVKNGDVTQNAQLRVTGIDYMDHLLVTSTVSRLTAGGTVSATVSILKADGSVYMDFSGDKSIAFTGADTLHGYVPTFTDKDAQAISFQETGILTFVNGVASTTLTLYAAGAVSVNATDNLHQNNVPLLLTVDPGHLAAFSLDAPDSVQVSTPFSVTLTALDPYGNMTSDVAEDIALVTDHGTLDVNSIPAADFTDGVGAHNLTFTGINADTSVSLTASSGGIKVSRTIKVQASSGSVAIIREKIDITDTRVVLLPARRLGLLDVPKNAYMFAVSDTPNFKGVSWERMEKSDEALNSFYLPAKLYVKFRTKGGSVSDILTCILTVTVSNSNDATVSPPQSDAPDGRILSDGDIVRTADSFDVYIIKLKNGKKYRRLILSPRVFSSYGHLHWENLKLISREQMDEYVLSDLVQVRGDVYIYRLFPSGDAGARIILDTSHDYDPDSIYEINSVDRDSYKLLR
jgi:hypothetical protein